MSKKRLIDATDLVRRVLEKRDKIRLEVVPRYGFGVPVPDQHGQAMVGGIRKALREIETSPTVDAVEVVRWKMVNAHLTLLQIKVNRGAGNGAAYRRWSDG